MIDEEYGCSGGTEAAPTADWLGSVFALYREAADFDACGSDILTPEFSDRTRQAARLAFDLRKLRQQRKLTGFVPVPLDQYLRGLGCMAAVALEPVLHWAGLSGDGSYHEESAAALARLGRTLGIGLRQLFLHLRIGLAERLEGAPVLMLLAGRKPADHERSLIDECEETLREIESRYGAKEQSRLGQLEADLAEAYEVAKAATA
jgi:hypothetical protein